MADKRQIFTPNRSTRSRTRLMLHISKEDAGRIGWRGHWGPVEITDLDSGTVLRVRSADCGAGCHCAAEVVKVVTKGHTAPAVLEEKAA